MNHEINEKENQMEVATSTFKEEFAAMPEREQHGLVVSGFYEEDELLQLGSLAKSSAVLRAINEALQTDITDYVEPEVIGKYNGPAFADKIVNGREYRFCVSDRRIKVRTGMQAWALHFKHEDLAELENRWLKLDQMIRADLTPSRQGAEVAHQNDPGSLLSAAMEQINTDYSRFQEVEKEATFLMLKIGITMEQVKATLPHGQFKKWTESNLTITYRHAHNFRKLAQVFIKAQQLEAGQMLALADPSHSQDELTRKLQQMAFEFLGDKTQGELFEEYGIRFREGKKKGLPNPPKNLPEVPDGETKAHLAAKGVWVDVANQINKYGLDRETSCLHHLRLDELQDLNGVLLDLKAKVEALIKVG
jgi:hypothetical protein